MLVAKERGQVVGTGIVRPLSCNCAEIVRMSVASAWRRGGIGSRLLLQLVAHARTIGAREVVLETTSTWHSAIALYGKYGFRKTHESGPDSYFVLALDRPFDVTDPTCSVLRPMNTTIPTVRNIDQIYVFVGDRAKAKQWYRRVLGFTRIEAFEFWAAGGGPLTVQNTQGTVHIALFERPPEKCRSTIALGASAAEFLARKAHLTRELPAPPTVEDHELSGSLYFRDPDGNPYEITTYEHAAARAGLAGGEV